VDAHRHGNGQCVVHHHDHECAAAAFDAEFADQNRIRQSRWSIPSLRSPLVGVTSMTHQSEPPRQPVFPMSASPKRNSPRHLRSAQVLTMAGKPVRAPMSHRRVRATPAGTNVARWSRSARQAMMRKSRQSDAYLALFCSSRCGNPVRAQAPAGPPAVAGDRRAGDHHGTSEFVGRAAVQRVALNAASPPSGATPVHRGTEVHAGDSVQAERGRRADVTNKEAAVRDPVHVSPMQRSSSIGTKASERAGRTTIDIR